MNSESVFEFVGFLANLAAMVFFIKGHKRLFSPGIRVGFALLLVIGGVKYLVNGLECAHLWRGAFVDPLEDYLDNLWPLTWLLFFYLAFLETTTKEARKSQERFLTMFKAAPLGIYIANPSGNFLEVNDYFLSMLGYSPDEIGTMTFQDITAPEDREENRRLVMEVREGKRDTFELEKSYITKSGERLRGVMLATAIRNKSGELLYWIGIVENVHQRKQTEEELEQYQFMVTSSSDFIALIDQQYRLLAVNEACAKAAAKGEDELLGLTLEEMVGEPSYHNVLREHAEECLSGKETHFQEWFDTPGLGTIYADTALYPCVRADGSNCGAVLIGRNITDMKTLETELENAKRLESLGTLAGGVAHNFNNLLMGIQGNAALGLLETEPECPQYKRFSDIHKLVESGSKLTRQLLSYARGGKYEVKVLDINKLVTEVSETFGSARKEITVSLDLQQDLPGVRADQSQIEQSLLNLLVNAAEAMEMGGSLSVESRLVEYNHICGKPADMRPGQYVLLSVTDTGVGIDEAIQSRIFDPFFTTKQMGKGTGLGLASVYGVIKGHGGHIEVSSAIGEGSTFRMYLPVSDDKVATPEVSAADIITGRGLVLLVDDEEAVLEVNTRLLKALGYTVLQCGSGKEAVELFTRRHKIVDLVILDMIMPGLSGSETYDRLKEINPEVKVILSSGYSMEGQASKIMKRGCDGFLQKPFDLRELSSKIEGVLRG